MYIQTGMTTYWEKTVKIKLFCKIFNGVKMSIRTWTAVYRALLRFRVRASGLERRTIVSAGSDLPCVLEG